MKFLLISDLHHFTMEEANLIKEIKYDTCVLLGDINNKYLEIIKNIINIKIYGVCGNHDEIGNLNKFNIINLHLKRLCIGVKNDICVVGFQGSSKYKNNCFAMYTQKEAKELFKQIKQADILFTHDNPYGLYNKKDPAHCGLKAISKYIKKYKPQYVIHGHHHTNERKKLYNTDIICIYRCAVFDYKTGSINIIF